MSILKGTIRGPSKTQLGKSHEETRGQTTKASAGTERHTGRERKYKAILSNVLTKDMDGETILYPYATVKLLVKRGKRNSIVEWPYWLRIVNPPDEIDSLYGGLQNVSETHPLVTVEFTGKTKKKGAITLGTLSADVDDYSGGEIKEYDGVMIV